MHRLPTVPIAQLSLDYPGVDPNAFGQVRKRMPFSRCHFCTIKSSFYQDRLGTTIGKALEKESDAFSDRGCRLSM